MYQRLIQFFGKIGTKYFGKKLLSLKELVEKSNLPIIYGIYVGQLFFYSFLSFFVFFIYFFFKFNLNFEFIIALISSILSSFTLSFFIATIFYLYPFYKYELQKKDIDKNFPLGIAYLNIILSSGIPPQKTFKLISMEDFGEFSKECERIHKLIHIVGRDIISAIQEIASRTPSDKLKNFFEGFTATINSGGNLVSYIKTQSKIGLLDYKERQKKFTSTMSFFADIFIVCILMVPLVITILLLTFSIIEPTVFGIDILLCVQILTYLVVPLIGIMFLYILYKIEI